MQELVIQGGRLLDKDVLPSNGDWSGIVSGFAAMRRLSAGRGKDSKSRFSKTTSLGDYHTLLWSLFDAGVSYLASCAECEHFIIFSYILVCHVLMFELSHEPAIENKNFQRPVLTFCSGCIC